MVITHHAVAPPCIIVSPVRRRHAQPQLVVVIQIYPHPLRNKETKGHGGEYERVRLGWKCCHKIVTYDRSKLWLFQVSDQTSFSLLNFYIFNSWRHFFFWIHQQPTNIDFGFFCLKFAWSLADVVRVCRTWIRQSDAITLCLHQFSQTLPAALWTLPKLEVLSVKNFKNLLVVPSDAAKLTALHSLYPILSFFGADLETRPSHVRPQDESRSAYQIWFVGWSAFSGYEVWTIKTP